MNFQTIDKILNKNSKVVFGPKEHSSNEEHKSLGLHYISVNVKEKTIMFTSDNQDYSMSKKLEEVMEILFSEFGIDNYKVKVHIHKGDWHDKDITLELKNSKMISNIVKFIQDNFYPSCKDWDFVTTE